MFEYDFKIRTREIGTINFRGTIKDVIQVANQFGGRSIRLASNNLCVLVCYGNRGLGWREPGATEPHAANA